MSPNSVLGVIPQLGFLVWNSINVNLWLTRWVAFISVSLTFDCPLIGGILIFIFTLSMEKHIFAAKFKQLLINQGVAEKARPYYHRHLMQWGRYLRTEKERRLAQGIDVDSSDFSTLFKDWLVALGGNPRMEDFQIRQAADTVKMAHGVLLGES